MRAFDYLYYSTCKFYAKTDKDGAGLSGLAVVALMQSFNLLSIDIIIELWFHRNFAIGKPSIIGLGILLLIMNGVRYNKLNCPVLKEKWDSEAENTAIRKRVWVFLYILISSILCISLAIYVGSKHYN